MGRKFKKVFISVLAGMIAGSTLMASVGQTDAKTVDTEYDLVELKRETDLIKNGGFESGSGTSRSNWSTTGSGTFTNYEGSAATGDWCGLLPRDTGNASVYQAVSLKQNTDYVLTAKVLLAQEGQTAFVNVKKSDLSGWTDMGTIETAVTCTADQTWQYQNIRLEFNSGSVTSAAVAIMKWTESTEDATYLGQVYVDEVSLVEKNPTETYDDNYDIIWADDFNGDTLDTSKWGYELGSIRGVEQQHYVNSEDNVYVKDGKLNLQITDRAKEDQYQNPRGNRQVIYNSGSVRTHGKQDFLFGRIEIKAKLPKGQAVFPAFWTLGSDFTLDGKINSEQGYGWPVCGEIDIMELVGKASDSTGSGNQTVWQTLHYGLGNDQDNGKYAGNGTGYSLSSGVFNDDYHVFGMNWSKGKIEWYVDDQIVRTVDYSDDADALKTLDRPQYVQLNLAAGGNWPGDAGTDLAGQKFEVEYVYYGQNEQQKADAQEYYDNAAKINGVKDVTMYQGDIPDLLDGVTSTNDTTLDFSVENEYMFKNEGGLTSVDLVCTGKDDAEKLATLPVGTYNIHYTAMKDKSTLIPGVRKSAILTVKERSLEADLNGQKLEGKLNSTLKDVALPDGWTWENPDTVIDQDIQAKAIFNKNGITKEETVTVSVYVGQVDTEIPEIDTSKPFEDVTIGVILDDAQKDALLSNASKELQDKVEELRNESKDVSVDVVASVKEDADIDAATKELIQSQLTELMGIAKYLDLSIVVSSEGNELGKITELGDPMKVQVGIPDELVKDGREFSILRVHGDEVTQLKGTLDKNVLTVETDRFSTYALVYTDQPEVVTETVNLTIAAIIDGKEVDLSDYIDITDLTAEVEKGTVVTEEDIAALKEASDEFAIDGYEFKGFYLDKEGQVELTAGYTFDEDTTLYMIYSTKTTEEPTPTPNPDQGEQTPDVDGNKGEETPNVDVNTPDTGNKPTTNVQTGTTQNSNGVKTSDESPMALYIALTLIAIGGVSVLIRKRKES